MAPPRRSAPARSAEAVAEDLVLARRAGGLARAHERDLEATLDLLQLAGEEADTIVARARDLLTHYVRRDCMRFREAHTHDKTAQAAANSLEELLLRPAKDSRLTQVVRREAVRVLEHAVSADAVRHREDSIIGAIATDVCRDLLDRRADEPRSVEAAIYQLVPIAADFRQQLHDGLCATYPPRPPADPRERKAFDGFYRQTVLKAAALLRASRQLARLGLTTPPSEVEYFFIRHARWFVGYLFDEAEDRRFMSDFSQPGDLEDWQAAVARLRESSGGEEVFSRWVEWMRSCYATCAYERTTEVTLMCSPHQLLTLLGAVETEYLRLGYVDLQTDGLPRLPVDQKFSLVEI